MPYDYIAIIVFDILAGCCCIVAEITQNKAKHLKHSDTALKLGVVAAVLLFAAHFYSNLVGYCLCCGYHDRREASGKTKSFLALSWLTFVAGLVLLVIGVLTTLRYVLVIGGINVFF